MQRRWTYFHEPLDGGGAAYRGYGATQGIFAVESAVNELAHKMGMDPARMKELNMPVEGGPLPGYPDVPYAQSCAMDRCMARAKEMMNWDSRSLSQDEDCIAI